MRCRRIVNGDVVWFGAISEQIPPQKSLEKTTWDELEAICHRGLHTSYFKIGDKKTVNIDGQDYTFVIADFDHYQISNSDIKACITFMMENVTVDKYRLVQTSTNQGGWPKSDLRNNGMVTSYIYMPADLRTRIERVDVESQLGDGSYTTSSELVFIPAAFELEQTRGTRYQFAYYRIIKDGTNPIDRIRYNQIGAAVTYWTRDADASVGWRRVSANGSVLTVPGTSVVSVPLCFNVGRRVSTPTQFFNENDKHDNYADKQQAVADSLTQRLSVIKSELWYNVYYGLPLLDKLQTKFPLDAFVTKTVQEHPDVVSIKSFTSKVVDHHYTCVMTIQSKYGEIQLNI